MTTSWICEQRHLVAILYKIQRAMQPMHFAYLVNMWAAPILAAIFIAQHPKRIDVPLVLSLFKSSHTVLFILFDIFPLVLLLWTVFENHKITYTNTATFEWQCKIQNAKIVLCRIWGLLILQLRQNNFGILVCIGSIGCICCKLLITMPKF